MDNSFFKKRIQFLLLLEVATSFALSWFIVPYINYNKIIINLDCFKILIRVNLLLVKLIIKLNFVDDETHRKLG